MTPLQEEALYAILAPHKDKLRFSIKWKFFPNGRFDGRSEARIIGAPKVKPLVVGSWEWEAIRRFKKEGYTGYFSKPLREVKISLVSAEFKALVERLI